MRTTAFQDQRFTDMVLDWVRDDVGISDLYGEDTIKKYAKDNFTPEDVFSAAELSEWAFDNGYRRVE